MIVGSGPNGLAAAITLARTGLSVLVIEGSETIGGGVRTAELTLPGFKHDVCSAIHPLGLASPFFRSMPLADYGLEWILPPVALAHPFDNDQAALLSCSLEASAETLGEDVVAYQKLMKPLVKDWEKTLQDVHGPFPIPPRYPLSTARFAVPALMSAYQFTRLYLRGARARAVFAGCAGHSMLPLEKQTTAGAGLLLSMLAHAVGFPLARGGSQVIVDTMAAYLKSLNGKIVTGQWVRNFAELPKARAVLFDITPRQLLAIASEQLPEGYKRQLERFRYGVGVFKVDYALSGPIPWKDPNCSLAATVHLGGTYEEIAAAERAPWRGEHSQKPLVLLAQSSQFDSKRAPRSNHTAWAYCHVPHGSTVDMKERIEMQIERFAPGFKDLVLESHTFNAPEMEAYNPNYIGGDINGGAQDLPQFFTRPVPRLSPYTTPNKNIFLCSSSTPPGGGVHGMCGFYAAKAALKQNFS